ncbi:MAG: hypothetical protein WKF77_26435 [Planctomycetaceae bacterium]
MSGLTKSGESGFEKTGDTGKTFDTMIHREGNTVVVCYDGGVVQGDNAEFML